MGTEREAPSSPEEQNKKTPDASPAGARRDSAAEEAKSDAASNSMITTEEVIAINNGRNLPTGQMGNDVATDTGSTIDTLDSAFHDALDINKAHTASGSNRAEFYESRSYGKSDSDEEVEALYKKNRKEPGA